MENSPLGKAIIVGNERIIRLLISKEANVNFEKAHTPFYDAGELCGNSILGLAIKQRANRIVSILLDHRANPNGGVKSSPLAFAIITNCEDSVRKLFEKGAKIKKTLPFITGLNPSVYDFVRLYLSRHSPVINDLIEKAFAEENLSAPPPRSSRESFSLRVASTNYQKCCQDCIDQLGRITSLDDTVVRFVENIGKRVSAYQLINLAPGSTVSAKQRHLMLKLHPDKCLNVGLPSEQATLLYQCFRAAKEEIA